MQPANRSLRWAVFPKRSSRNYTMPTEQIAALSVHDLKIQAENNFDEKRTAGPL